MGIHIVILPLHVSLATCSTHHSSLSVCYLMGTAIFEPSSPPLISSPLSN